MKKYDQFINEADDDFSFLDRLIGKHKKDQKDPDDPRLKFELPDGFVGGTNVLRPKNPQFKNALDEGDRIIYRKAGSEHDGKKGTFRKIRDDGKFSITFDDGTKFAANGNNVQSYVDQLAKKDIKFSLDDREGVIKAYPMKGKDMYKSVTKLFSELGKIGFTEQPDGSLLYSGDLNMEELKSELQERDFVVDDAPSWP